jgi:hypothetical protein
MRAFEFKNARINQDPNGGGGKARAAARLHLLSSSHHCLAHSAG